MTVRSQAVLGVVMLLAGLAIIAFYLTTDKAHAHEQVVLWVGVGFAAFGAHTISRQSVRLFLGDFARFLPWGRRTGTTDELRPPDGPGA
jgi:hypothetical protein